MTLSKYYQEEFFKYRTITHNHRHYLIEEIPIDIAEGIIDCKIGRLGKLGDSRLKKGEFYYKIRVVESRKEQEMLKEIIPSKIDLQVRKIHFMGLTNLGEELP
ncbi:MAG: hypothetical protein GTN38_00980 [Candidatus Aenigmarchaeota archaeon]|nr:hypothetical protein [Candidatus Aenigmarchaeota archaeon]NIP40161.1 hypothetical protein [Candidatus Aenigmarchaeota archaeon]NIQ17205.1 hypothetical protein [Candidatus Aenigmarchaeota archaeon]NIS72995.1 hypothetical protein [Candidatus Aenigmarchaeota archaeon]